MNRAHLAALLLALWAPLTPAATMTIINADDPGEGLNDPTPTSSDQGTPGLTLGEARMQALQFAADYWGQRLDSAVAVKIEVDFKALPCNSNSGQLGMAGSNFIFVRSGPDGSDTFYPAALADALRGRDNLGGEPDVLASFNKSVDDGDSCLPGKWYYGTDGNNGNNTDFVETVKHELAHGLGFSSFTDTDGSYPDSTTPGIWDHFTRDETRGADWVDLSQSQRASSYTNDQQVTWSGAAVTSVANQFSAGVHPSGRIKLYAPNPVELGSSLSHWDSSLTPDAIMEPVTDGTGEIVEIATCLFRDIGWTIIGNGICSGNVATPTPTPTPGTSPTPSPTPTVTPTPASNLPPVIGNLVDRATNEDFSISFSVSLSDDNTPVEQLTVDATSSSTALIDSAGISVSLGGSRADITLVPNPDANGSASITLTVTDGGGLSSSDSFTVTFNAVNDPPTIAAIAPQSGDEDQALTVQVAIDDVDDPVSGLALSAQTDAAELLGALELSGTGNIRSLTITPASNASGTATVTLSLDDGEASVTRDFSVTIRPVNDPPRVTTQVQTRLINAGESVSIDLSTKFSDVDGDTLSYAATGLPDGLSLAPGTGLITGTVDAALAADSPFAVQATATDPAGESASLNFDLVVAANAIDVGVELEYAADRFVAGETVSFTVRLSNQGSRAASQVGLLVKLDGLGLGTPTLPAACSTGAASPPFEISCAIGTLAADESTQLSFSVPTSAATDVLVDAGSSHADEDSVTTNDSALLGVRVVADQAPASGRSLGTGNVTAVAAGDIDGDGALDLVMATGPAEPVRVLFSAASSAPALISLGGSAEHTAAAIADLDGDGRPDVITGTAGGLVQIFTNLGSRNFRLQSTVTEGAVVDLASADFDADGFDDIAALQSGRLEIIDGNGRRVVTRLTVSGARAVAAADFNGDVRPDLIVAGGAGKSQLFRNTGNLQFAAIAPFDAGDAQGVAAADLNGDLANDLVFANRITRNASATKLLAESASNRVYLGNGDLSFTELQRLGAIDSVGVSLADVDADGDVDALFATGAGGVAVFRNDGSGFSADPVDPIAGAAHIVITPDLNGDGTPDLVTVSDGAGVKALFNSGGVYTNAGSPTPTPTPGPTATATPSPTPTPAPAGGGGGGSGSTAPGTLIVLLILGVALRLRARPIRQTGRH